jgi:hypothetical protein
MVSISGSSNQNWPPNKWFWFWIGLAITIAILAIVYSIYSL